MTWCAPSKILVGNGSVPPFCDQEAGQLRHHERDENRDQAGARDGEERRINQRLLDAVAQVLRLHQVFDQARQNIGKRATRLAGGDEVHIDRRKDAREIPEGLRKAAAIHQGLVERMRHLLHFRLLQTLLEDRQPLIERHSGPEQMAKLLGKNQQLAVRDF